VLRISIGLLLAVSALAQTLRFGILGDSGTGDETQKAVARQMERRQLQGPWKFVLFLGDNVYDEGNPKEFEQKFGQVYRALAAGGVQLHATLGNHDRIHRHSRRGMAQVEDPSFGYVAQRDEYVYVPRPLAGGQALVRFLCLNSDAWIEELDQGRPPAGRLAQLRGWLDQSGQYHWNFVVLHHPLYSFVRRGLFGLRGHGPSRQLREVIEPLLVAGKIDAVFAGHEHFYMKIRPQKGIHHFISGGGGQKVRPGADLGHAEVEAGAEQNHFLDLELDQERLSYQAISVAGTPIHPPRTIAK